MAKEKKGLWAGIKNIINEPEPGTTAVAESDTPVFGGGAPGNVKWRPSGPPISTTVNPAMLVDIEQALAQRSPQAYGRFATLLVSLQQAVPDEAVRFAAAIATAGTVQLKLPEVVQAYSARVGLVDQLEEEFKAQSAAALAEQDGVNEEIRRLDEQITAATAQRDRLNRQLETKKAEIATTNTGMLAAFQAVRTKATTERDALSRHTQGKA